jgi:hypothetical protein
MHGSRPLTRLDDCLIPGDQVDGLYHTDSHGMVGVTATAGTGEVSPGPPIPFAETLVGLSEK